MGLMNEPHDVDIGRWADTVQTAVTAIRKAEATSHHILLPGNGFTSAGAFPSGSAPALSKVTNPDGSFTNLIFEVHQYLDSDGSGTHSNCVKDGIDAAFAPLAQYLRKNKRIAFLAETGGGSHDESCFINVCKALAFLNKNADVYLGYTGWAAGSFSTTYGLSLTPTGSGPDNMIDQPLLTKCFASKPGVKNLVPQQSKQQKAPVTSKSGVKKPARSSSAALHTPPASSKAAGQSKQQKAPVTSKSGVKKPVPRRSSSAALHTPSASSKAARYSKQQRAPVTGPTPTTTTTSSTITAHNTTFSIHCSKAGNVTSGHTVSTFSATVTNKTLIPPAYTPRTFETAIWSTASASKSGVKNPVPRFRPRGVNVFGYGDE